ncbi:helix-turn-helix domain-containing protein [Polaromonas sp.]|uniref:helix-turn-helix domain-containing protein n=1 Tax=Polaromonas sp. TaxID=1869339 RepID=UPI003C8BAF8C
MQQAPLPSLAGLVRLVWTSTPEQAGQMASRDAREFILPSGEMHLVIRLSGPPIRIFEKPGDVAGQNLGYAVVGGARAAFYAKEVPAASQAIGVQLLPGAAQALLGMPADELAGRHIRLEDLWGHSAAWMREQLLATASPAKRMCLIQTLLLARLRPASAPAHPAITRALVQLRAGAGVREAVAQSGYSHRHFIRQFSQAVGLPPKLYGRVQRFQQALDLMQRSGTAQVPRLPDVALDAGYSDQPHFNREFRQFSGLTPEQYLRAPVVSPNHVPVPAPFARQTQVNFVQDLIRTRR